MVSRGRELTKMGELPLLLLFGKHLPSSSRYTRSCLAATHPEHHANHPTTAHATPPGLQQLVTTLHRANKYLSPPILNSKMPNIGTQIASWCAKIGESLSVTVTMLALSNDPVTDPFEKMSQAVQSVRGGDAL